MTVTVTENATVTVTATATETGRASEIVMQTVVIGRRVGGTQVEQADEIEAGVRLGGEFSAALF